MAKSKTTTTAVATKATKAAAPKAKKAAPVVKAKAAKAAAPKAAEVAAAAVAPKAAAGTATKADTPKAKKATVTKTVAKAVAKKVAPVKLTDKQAEFLKSIALAGATGYKAEKKAEAKSLESLLGKKLIKKGAKDKATGVYHYTVSKAGEKHLAAPGASAQA